MKISKREKILILAAVYLLVVFGGFKLMINPAWEKLDQAKAVNGQIDQAVQKAVQESKTKDDSQTEISEDLNGYLQLKEQLPGDKQLVEIVDQMGDMADSSKVTLMSVNYAESAEKTNAQTTAPAVGKEAKTDLAGISGMDLKLSVLGSYYHLLEFLQALEKSTRIVAVKSVSFQVGQRQEQTAAAIGTTASGTTYTNNSNPPPAAPLAKGTRVQTSVSAGTTATVQPPAGSGVIVREMSKYDMGSIQMNLLITTYYNTSLKETDKLLEASAAKQAAAKTAAAQDANLVKVTAAVKKFWNPQQPAANWSNLRDPGEACWNGQLLHYLEGKYSNTNMGKNVAGLVNAQAKTINPGSQWAGTAVLHWNRILDMNITSAIRPVDPDSGQTYTNVKTRDLLPAAVYITYLPNYAPDQVSKLSASQKQAVAGSVIVWQARNSKAAPMVYRIDAQGQVQDLQPMEANQ